MKQPTPEQVQVAIHAAVLNEREACACICDAHNNNRALFAAEEIRVRSES